MAKLRILLVVLFSLYFHKSESIKCYSCSSEKEKQCTDLVGFNYTSSSSSAIQIIDCSNEAATRQFIDYFSNLLSVLGVPVEVNTKFNTQLAKKKEQIQACQKVVMKDESGQIVIRDCAVLSEIACDSLKTEAGLYISFCEVCDADYCNYSTRSVTNWNLAITIVLASFIFNNHFFSSHF